MTGQPSPDASLRLAVYFITCTVYGRQQRVQKIALVHPLLFCVRLTPFLASATSVSLTSSSYHESSPSGGPQLLTYDTLASITVSQLGYLLISSSSGLEDFFVNFLTKCFELRPMMYVKHVLSECGVQAISSLPFPFEG